MFHRAQRRCIYIFSADDPTCKDELFAEESSAGAEALQVPRTHDAGIHRMTKLLAYADAELC